MHANEIEPMQQARVPALWTHPYFHYMATAAAAATSAAGWVVHVVPEQPAIPVEPRT